MKIHTKALMLTVLMSTGLMADMGTFWTNVNLASASSWNGLRTHCNPKNLWDDGTTGINTSLLLLGIWSVPLVYNLCLWKWRTYQVSRDINKGRKKDEILKATPENIKTVYEERHDKKRFDAITQIFSDILYGAEKPPEPTNFWKPTQQKNAQGNGLEQIAQLMAGYAEEDQVEQEIKERNERIAIAQEKLEYPASYSKGTVALTVPTLCLGACSMLFVASTGFRTFWGYAIEASVKTFVTRVIPYAIIANVVSYVATKANTYAFNRLESLRPKPPTVNLYNDSHRILRDRAARHSLFADTGQLIILSLIYFTLARHLVHWRTTL